MSNPVSRLGPPSFVPVRPSPAPASEACDPNSAPPPEPIDAASFVLYDRNAGLCRIAPPLPGVAAPGTSRRTVVSEAEAARLFRELSSMTFVGSDGQVRSVPYTYPIDGCYARAHAMAQRIAARGVDVRKVFAEGDLRVASRYAGDAPATQPGEVRWGWHVAPTIRVRDAQGMVRVMVMDPSLASHPITVDEWNGLMGGGAQITHAGANAYYPSDVHGQRCPTQETSARAQEGALPVITAYAESAEAHELAASVRTTLEAQSGTCDERAASARRLIDAAPESVRLRFLKEYPMLAQLAACPPTGS